MKKITIPISLGELIDKITILEIKISNIVNVEKVKKVKHEHHLLMQVMFMQKIPINEEPMSLWIKELHDCNQKIWDAENILRQQESSASHSELFRKAAVDAFSYNMKRHAVKQSINQYFNSEITEEKQYG